LITIVMASDKRGVYLQNDNEQNNDKSERVLITESDAYITE